MVVSGISFGFPKLSRCEGQIAHVLLTRSPLVYSRRSLTARLACVKHAASVRPEPGSNSPLKFVDSRPPEDGRSSVHWSIPARDAPQPCGQGDFLTKGTVYRDWRPTFVGLPPCRRGVINSFVDFWHTVEFSRIGRAPSARASQSGSGQLV